ncbi:hypothetical protein PENTCL1PPCAC_11867, partial [Pristionchus entomophagus]
MTESARRRNAGGTDANGTTASTSGAPQANGVAPNGAIDEQHLAEEPPGLCGKILCCGRSNRVADSYQPTNQDSGEATAPTQTESATPPVPIEDKYILDKSSDWYYRWLVLVTLAFLYNLIFNIARFVFDDLAKGLLW